MSNNKTLIIVISLILLGVAGFFGYRYLKNVNISKQEKMETKNEENRNSENSNKEMNTDNETNESVEVQDVKTTDSQIDKELENLDQSLDLQLDEEVQ